MKAIISKRWVILIVILYLIGLGFIYPFAKKPQLANKIKKIV